MSRRSNSKREFPIPDPVYNSYLVSLLTVRILKSGKKTLAQRIIQETFNIIKERTNEDPLKVFEKAIKNGVQMRKNLNQLLDHSLNSMEN